MAKRRGRVVKCGVHTDRLPTPHIQRRYEWELSKNGQKEEEKS